MRKLEYTTGATSPFEPEYRPARPSSQEEEERHPDGLFFVVGILVGLILAWIIL